MKYIRIYAYILFMFVSPVVSFAQTPGTLGTLQAFIVPEDPAKMLETISLWSTLTIAFITSVMVWIGGRKMRGGVFERVLTLFSVGMTLIFFGFATEVPWFQDVNHLYLKVTHDSLNIIGYVLMGIAAGKLLKVIKGE